MQDARSKSRSGCSTGVGLNYPRTIALSPDGKNAYVASDSADGTVPGDAANGDAVSAFSRDPETGALRQLPGYGACVKDTLARSTTSCPVVGRGLLGAFHVTVSPDGRHVYVGSHASRAGAVAIFERDGETGKLIQLEGGAGCLGNGRDCRPAKGIKGTDSVTITPDGKHAYVTGFSARRSRPSRGTPTPGSSHRCAAGAHAYATRLSGAVFEVHGGLMGPRGVFLSPDVKTAYVPSSVGGLSTCSAWEGGPTR